MNTIKLNVLGEAKAAAPGAEIKNQDKSVDITENGVTEVTADSGYTGLGKVTINANVQGGGGVRMIYVKNENLGNAKSAVEGYSQKVRYRRAGATNDLPTGLVYLVSGSGGESLAFAFVADMLISPNPNETLTIEQMLKILEGQMNISLTYITKEEYDSLS